MDGWQVNYCGHLIVSISLAAVSRRVSGSNREAHHHATARNSSPLTEACRVHPGLTMTASSLPDSATKILMQTSVACSLRSLPRLQILLIILMHTAHVWG